MAEQLGDRIRKIAEGVEREAAFTSRPGQFGELTRLAAELREHADSIDETFAVLDDPEAMAAIEDAEGETVSSAEIAAALKRRALYAEDEWLDVLGAPAVFDPPRVVNGRTVLHATSRRFANRTACGQRMSDVGETSFAEAAPERTCKVCRRSMEAQHA